MNISSLKLKSFVQGISFWISGMQYNPLVPSGDSSLYFGVFEGQRFGAFDTDDCWDFSGCELLETRLEMLEKLGKIPQLTLDWAKRRGWKDSDGNWYASRRWEAIISGVRDGGNAQQNFWELAATAGVIPNTMLPYSMTAASAFRTKNDFNNSYFDPQAITQDMELAGKEFIQYFSIKAKTIQGGYIGDVSDYLVKYLKEGSIQIGIPVPQDGTWNRPLVTMPAGRFVADHAIELYKFVPGDPFPFRIYDSYEPHLKALSADYYIPYVTRVSIVPL